MKKLKLTDTEYGILIDLVFAGNTVINAWRLPTDIIKPYQDFCDSLTEQSGITDAEYNAFAERLERFYEQRTEKEVLRQLAELLAKSQHRSEPELTAQMERYDEELSKNGLKSVRIEVTE